MRGVPRRLALAGVAVVAVAGIGAAALDRDGRTAADDAPAAAGPAASGVVLPDPPEGAPTPAGPPPAETAAAVPAPVEPGPAGPPAVGPDGGGPPAVTPADAAAGLLSLDVPEAATGVLDVVPGSAPAPGPGPVRAVRVEVERGLPVDGAAFAATVMTTLNDPRGWGAHGEVSFARTDGPADIRVLLASPDLVDALCAPLDTGGEVSCGRNGHAALNFRRWVLATPEFADLTQYRQYLVNHEVGHLLGHPHEQCPGAGQPAPLMQQQTLAVAPCEPNGWPYPQG